MKMLEDRIRKDGIVREGNVLKVDSFINHQMDIPLFREMAREWKRLFAGKPINKVLTIEASGIGIAAILASEFNVPVVFAKKSMSINLDYDNYKTQIQSFTHKKIYNVIVSKKFLTPEDHILIIDAFLAKKLRDPEDRKECKKASDALARRGFSWSEIAAGIERRKYQTD